MNIIKPVTKWHLISWEKNINDLKTTKLYGDRYFFLDKKLALDRCPHRGSCLSTGTLLEKSVKCPYHNHYFSPITHDEMFGGVIKDRAFWYGGNDINKIPRIFEFDDDSYRSLYLTRELKGVNTLEMVQNSLDWEHLTSVHSVRFVETLKPEVILDKVSNKQIHLFENDDIGIRIEGSFWLPYSNCLKFTVTNKKKKKTYSPFMLFFSMIPNDQNNTTLHIRFMRKKLARDLEPLLDLFYIAVVDIPVWEDANIVRNVDTKRIFADQLSDEDCFIELYRKKMLKECSELINYFI